MIVMHGTNYLRISTINTSTPLHPGNWYHIYNRGIDSSPIFSEEPNYFYFLKLLAKHVASVAEFQILVRVVRDYDSIN